MTAKVMQSKTEEYVHDYNQKYYQKNKTTLLQSAKVTVTCECGTICPAKNLTRHQKTKLHEKKLINKTKNGTEEILPEYNNIKIGNQTILQLKFPMGSYTRARIQNTANALSKEMKIRGKKGKICVQLEYGKENSKSGALTKIGTDVKLYEEEGDEVTLFKTFSILFLK